jgi:hypothetical protein
MIKMLMYMLPAAQDSWEAENKEML